VPSLLLQDLDQFHAPDFTTCGFTTSNTGSAGGSGEWRGLRGSTRPPGSSVR